MSTLILDIPGTTKKMHIKRGTGHHAEVTDEAGIPAETRSMEEMKIKFGNAMADIIEVGEGSTFVTRHNPTCRWYFINGTWQYICA